VKSGLTSLVTRLGQYLLIQPIQQLSRLAAGQEQSLPTLPGELGTLAAKILELQQQLRLQAKPSTPDLDAAMDRKLSHLFHRLRTPLTRLRLRVERVEDTALKDILRQDLRLMSELLDDAQDALQSGCITPDTKRTNPLYTSGPG